MKRARGATGASAGGARRARKSGIALALACLALVALGCTSLRERDDGARLPAGVPGTIVEVDGHRVRLIEAGQGPALVLIHGFGASTHDFEETVLEALAGTHRVIAIDLYGNGWSERHDAFAYGWTLWSEQVAGVLDALAVPRATILGHSMGGAVATVFAARHPDRTERLILADSFYPPEPGEIPWTFRGLRVPLVGELMLGLVADASAPGFSEAHAERARAWYRIRGTRRALLGYVRDEGKLPELSAAYPLVKARTLVLHGKADAFVAYAAMERAAPALRNARVVTLEGGHFPFRDDRAAFLREVEAFLAQPAGE